MIKLFGTSFSSRDQRLIDFLKRDRLFEKLTERELSHFVPYMHERTYHSDEVIFFSGDPSQAIYLVKSGMVTLNIEIKGNFEKLVTLRAGNAFGDNSLLENTNRIYSALVATDSATLYIIPQVNLLEIMDQHKRVRAKIMTAFSKTYNEYTARLFKAYKNSLGFLDLNEVYVMPD